MNIEIAANIFAISMSIVVLFQLALSVGLPWGTLAMGGKFPGRVPPAIRVACVAQALILVVLTSIVFIKARLIYPEWHSISEKLIWVVVLVSVLAVIANLATPSKWERIIWSPIAIVLLVCSIIVATG